MASLDPNHELIRALQQQLAELRQDARTVEQAIAVIKRRGVQTSEGRMRRHAAGDRSGSVTQFILTYLREHPHASYDAVELFEHLAATGWKAAPQIKDPLNGFRTALARLVTLGEIRRVGPGVYQALDHEAAATALAVVANGEAPND